MTRHSAGFTLVELISAITVMVLVVGATGVLLHSVADARHRIEREIEAQQQAHAVAQAVGVALANTHRPPEANDRLLEGTNDWLGEAPADRVRLFTVSTRVIRAEQPESDVREVEFFLAAGEEGSPAAGLYRRTDPTRNAPPDEGGVVERIADNIVSFDLQYHDGASWQNDWPVRPGAWPRLVRVRIEVLVDPDRRQTFTLSRTINFPYMETG